MYYCFVVRPVKMLAEQVKSECFFLQGFFLSKIYIQKFCWISGSNVETWTCCPEIYP